MGSIPGQGPKIPHAIWPRGKKKAPRSCNQKVVNLSWKARSIPYHHQLPGTKEQSIAIDVSKDENGAK